MSLYTKVSSNKIFNRIRKFRAREENKELLNHSVIALVIRVAGAGIAFLMNVVVARKLGASEAGYFFLAVTCTSVLATIGRVGADQTVLRFIGMHSAMSEWPEIHAVIKKMMSWTYLPLILLTILVCVFARPISVYFFHKEELQWPLFWTSLSMPFFAGYNVLGMALQGIKKVMLSTTTLKILTPLFLIILITAFNLSDSYSISIFYTIACILNLVAGYIWWHRNTPSNKEKIEYNGASLWQSCWPLWITSIMQQLTIWSGQLIAGIYVSTKEVAQLAVARNTTVLVVFILMAVNNVSAPRFAAMYRKGEMQKLKNYARNSTLLMTLVALPITLLLWFFPQYVMSLFGKDFKGGIWLLRIIAAGQFVNVITGSVGSLLIMSGHENDLKNIRLINGVLAIASAVILTALYGAIGSAISSAIATASFNLMAVRQVKKRLGFSTISLFGLK